jgi:hypothetical protein
VGRGARVGAVPEGVSRGALHLRDERRFDVPVTPAAASRT